VISDRRLYDGIRTPPRRQLSDYGAVVYRRRYLVCAVTLLVAGVAMLRAFNARPVYRASAEILVARQMPQVLEFRDVAGVDSQSFGDEYHLTQLKLIESRSLARRVVEKLDLAQDPDFGRASEGAGRGPSTEGVVDSFLARVDARRVAHSQIITVAFEAPRAELAARAANTLAEAFIEEAVRARAETAGQVSSWLAAQIEEQRGKVQAAQEALRRLAEETGVVNFEERRTLIEQKLKQLGAHVTDVKARRLQSEALYRAMSSVPDPHDLSMVIGNRTFQELRIELSRLERREAELLGSHHLDQHPEVVKVRAQIAQARGRLASEAAHILKAAENDYRAAAAQERELQVALEQATAEALDLNRRGLRYDASKRELEAGQAVLNSLLARSKQTDVAQELRASPIRIVDRAVAPARPVGPRRKRMVALGLLLGLVAGVALALLVDRLDPRIRTPLDVRARLGAPVLAVVPQAAVSARPALFDSVNHDSLSEAYRTLRTALDHLWPAEEARVVVVVSTAPREGKTTCAVNLALALAARDEEVLLVDGDLRRPQVHDALRVSRAPGLTEMLGGRLESGPAVQEVAGTRLRVIASGSASAAPAEALKPAALRALLTVLRERFRWVVVDTSPLEAVSDASTLAALGDGVVLVVAADRTPWAAAAQTIERLDQLGCRVLGVVLNRARLEGFPYGYGARFGHHAVQTADAKGRELAAAE
jgi:succinoglycan biosynthesis transport protein ExoP